MRPALQRLVARPSNRELLRLLVGNEGAVGSFAPVNSESSRGRGRGLRLREYSGLAVAAARVRGREGAVEGLENRVEEDAMGEALKAHLGHLPPSASEMQEMASDPQKQRNAPNFTCAAPPSRHESDFQQEGVPPADTRPSPNCPERGMEQLVSNDGSGWTESMFSHERLEFESDLSPVPSTDQQSLLNSTHGNDMSLWAMLLDYRKRIHGMDGVETFWNAIQQRDVQLPTKGHLADKLWHPFLTLGFEKPVVLESIYQYAERHKHQNGTYFSGLYPRVVGHFLTKHQGYLALKWHNRLRKIHPPGPRTFAEMCREVVLEDGDLGTLKQIYNTQPHRNIYSQLIPLFCQRERYKLALQWHSFLCKIGDYPSSAKVAEPLVKYLSTCDPPSARRVTQDLVQAGTSFVSSLSPKLEDRPKFSREMMNTIHGKTMNIPIKKYNDELGARWFASTWVSLDAAINAVHDLGVQEIGPLSLQAIALRDLNPEAIVARIAQLKMLGISIGKSLYSRAVERFANDGKFDLLDGLLHSDQHPDELQKYDLQEALLASYVQGEDWTSYRRTLEIRLLASVCPEIEKRNVELRMVTKTSDISVALRGLEDMLIDGIPVKGATISLLLKHTFGARRKGRRPVSLPADDGRNAKNSLIKSIEMLKAIMRSGTYVHPTLWHEIIRRTGMLGHMSSLRELCSWLATCYGPQNHNSTESWLDRYRVPVELPTSHGRHQLRVLFPTILQKSIVEWGFLASHPQPSDRVSSSHSRVTPSALDEQSSTLTSGIYILNKLDSLGVHIERASVRKAIFDRLIIYFGPGHSSRPCNEERRKTIGTLEDVAKQIDEALGGEFFTADGLEETVNQMALVRLGRRERKMERRGKGKGGRLRRGPSRKLLSGEVV